jgi:hypothetical protein
VRAPGAWLVSVLLISFLLQILVCEANRLWE